MIIFVGSTNPVKLNAARQAATEKLGLPVRVEGLKVASGVNSQPRSDQETQLGARNRATAALAAGVKRMSEAHELASKQEIMVGLGLEGGVCEIEGELWSTVWAAVADQQGNVWDCNGARFKLPPPVAEPIAAGAEMGPAVSALFNGRPISTTNGMIGIVTGDYVSRTEEYANLAKLALGLWYGRDWTAQLTDGPYGPSSKRKP